jgi:hypothetical protein
VPGVGGTQLYVSSDGTYLDESAWSGSGGGYSKFQTEPSYQRTAQASGLRTSPDVAWNAAVGSGVSVYSTMSDSGSGGWFSVGGTSAGTPAWAAIIAIADQGRAINGLGSLAGAQSVLYSLPSSNFHDITVGRNGYSAGGGYDLVTGLGSPYVDRAVAALSTLPNAGNGNYAAAASPKRVRRLHRFRAKKHDMIAESTGSQFGLTILDPISTSAGNQSVGTGRVSLIQITTLNANQALVFEVVSKNGRLVEEVIVQMPEPDIASMTTSHTIAPITASLLMDQDPMPDVQRVGQGDDPEVPSTDLPYQSDESPLPPVIDLLDQMSRVIPGHDRTLPEDGIPADLAPQDPPAEQLRHRESLPLPVQAKLGAVIAVLNPESMPEETIELPQVDPVPQIGRQPTRQVSDEQDPDQASGGTRITAAAIAMLGGPRLIQFRSRRPSLRPAFEQVRKNQDESTRKSRAASRTFGYFINRGWRS